MVFELEGRYWQLPTLKTGEPVSDFLLPSHFVDFYEPLVQGAEGSHPMALGLSHCGCWLSYLPRVCHGLETVETWLHLGLIFQGRFYSWVAAYDSDYHCYGPGRQLLHYLLKESFERGHREFDFLRGNEAYKWKYATHTRLIAEMGH